MSIIISILLIPIVQTILKIVVIIFLFVMPLATVLTLMERKWSAMIQDRVGPNRANIPFLDNFRGRGAVHIAADGLKSFSKKISSRKAQIVFYLRLLLTLALLPVWRLLPSFLLPVPSGISPFK